MPVQIPEIETERLLLRGWRPADLEPLAAINADARVGAWLAGTLSESETKERLDRYLRHWLDAGFGMWAVEEKASERLIGRTGLTRWDDWTASAHDAEIGWTFHPDVWGRGYATEAALAALAWAPRRNGLRHIISVTRPENLASRRVMEKIGLTLRGEAFWHGFHQVWYATELTGARTTGAP